jgi:hypothetical protein
LGSKFSFRRLYALVRRPYGSGQIYEKSGFYYGDARRLRGHGRKQAVAETLGIKWRGAPAWFLARSYHLLQLPGAARKARLLFDWTIDLMFGRYAYEVSQLAARRCSAARSRSLDVELDNGARSLAAPVSRA